MSPRPVDPPLVRRVAIAILVMVAVSLRGSRLPAANENEEFYRCASGVSLGSGFLEQARTARASIPDAIWDAVRRAGWEVELAEFVSDAAPQWKDNRPRGWPANYTWNHTDAMNLPSSRRLVLAEKRLRPNGEVVTSARVAGVFRHELGHAFDMVCGQPRYRFGSSQPDFVAAYESDVAELTEQQRDSLRYYLQYATAGRQEAFAEAFALTLGGGSDVTKQQEFRLAFPAVLGFVRQEIARRSEP